MTEAADLTLWLAFGAGMLSFLNPCTVPLYPAYLSYITGMSVKDLEGNHNVKVRSKLIIHSVFFLIGVSFVFISLGASASFLGQWAQGILTGSLGLFIQRIAGIFIIIMGLFVAGWLNITFFMKERRFRFAKKPAGYVGTTFVGVGFATGWTPCIGPILATILFLAASNPNQGMLYTGMYIIGFAIPFLTLTFFIGSTKWIVRYSQALMKIGGVIMIVMGLLLFTGQMTKISAFVFDLIKDTWLINLG